MKTLYPLYRAALLDNGVDLVSGNIKIVGLDNTYVYDDGHEFLDDLTGTVATSGNLASKTATAGVFASADASLGSPGPGDTIVAYVMYRDTGTPATSALVLYSDEDSAASPISVATDSTEKIIACPSPGWFRP